MFEFGTKAETLERIRPFLTRSSVAGSVVFTVADWESRRAALLRDMERAFGEGMCIVRSSSLCEDAEALTLAGQHESVPHVRADRPGELAEAVETVIRSYARSGNCYPGDQILVQPMLTDISMCGVVFTRDLNTGGPYYVINYDDATGRHDTVTAGSVDVSRTLLIRRSHASSLRSPRFCRLMEAVLEIEALVSCPDLDIEFAVDTANRVHLFQVRRLPLRAKWNREAADRVDAALGETLRFLSSRFGPLYGALGKTSLFGIMPDWNPVEMIGAAPRQLASSLYRYLITDSVWAEARALMGYRDQSRRPLMFSLCGREYIDVRESLNSFLPAHLPDPIGEKLVDHWLEVLAGTPELHDKIEFEVAITVHPLDFESRAKPALVEGGLSKREAGVFSDRLRDLTNRAVGGPGDLVTGQLRLVERMLHRREAVLGYEGRAADDRLLKVRALLHDCREYGTRPFSILARCAFMGEEFLRSAVRAGLLTPERAGLFRASIPTVMTEFLVDVERRQRGRLCREEFFRKYGHLRPGSYDILSRRYDAREDFLDGARQQGGPASSPTPAGFALTDEERTRIDGHLARHGYAFDSERLFRFIRRAVRARESSKFHFTRNISDSLELLAAWGVELGLTREDLSHIPISALMNALNGSGHVPRENRLRRMIERNRELLAVTQAVRLPFLIREPGDVDVVPLLKCRPNFITQKRASGRAVLLTGREEAGVSLRGCMIFIEGADPGFDWIFTRGPAALVTKFGGANSHMAIRCAEFGLPAAIGCGEQLFESLLAAEAVVLDCGAETILPLR